MPQDNQEIDVVAILTQLQVLKQQRTNAMDDVAILMGQLESKRAAYDELDARYNSLITETAQKAGEAAPDPDGPGSVSKEASVG